MIRSVLAPLLAVLACLMPLVGPVAPASARAIIPSYVALGDSYSAGTGTRTYLDDGTSCSRSVKAYPSLIAADRGWRLHLEACLGATIASVARNQLDALRKGTDYVTISVGGNDAGFTQVLTTCAKPRWASNCHTAVDRARRYIKETLPGALATLYRTLRTDAPSATVVVVGYPRLFDGEDCNAGTWFSPKDEQRLNATADLLDRTLRIAASAAHFRFADPRSRFEGHAVCDDPEWLNGLSRPISDSYHPNATGHAAGYAPLVNALL